jgi:hypothetical protein
LSQPPELAEPPAPIPYAYGELYQGLMGHWHSRAQVLPTWPQEFTGTTRGAWLPGPPWRVDDIPNRRWPFVGSGLGSLEGPHRELVEQSVVTDASAQGPWRKDPETPLGNFSFLLASPLEASLIRRGWLWVDHKLVVHVRGDDYWLRGPTLTPRALPGSGLSPVLAAAMS